MDGRQVEQDYNRLARKERVAVLRREGGNLRGVDLNAIADAVNQCREKPSVIRDPSSGRGGRWKSREWPEQGGRRGASLGHGRGSETRRLSAVKNLVWEGIVHLATWCL